MDNILILSDDGKTIKGVNDNVVHLIIPDGVTNIGSNAFKNCTSLQNIVIPNSVISIESCAFYGCTDLTSITIPDSVVSIGFSAFTGCSGLTSVTIGNGVKKIGDGAFSCCSGLTSVAIPDSVTTIGEGVFGSCSGLSHIVVNSNNKYYDSRGNCNAIIETKTNILMTGCKDTIIPDDITAIGNSAFLGQTSLISIIIPDRVTKIGDYAFQGCKSLKNIIIPDNVVLIGEDAFNGTLWYDLQPDVIYINNILYEIKVDFQEETLYIKEGTKRISPYAFIGCKSLRSISFPKSLTHIGYGAFACCQSLHNIEIPCGIISISDGTIDLYGTFQECESLQNISIPNSVATIGDQTFSGCKSLQSVDIPNSVTTIGAGVFAGCSSIRSVDLPNSITSIGISAFAGCASLESIDIPDSVTIINTWAFSGCVSLQSIDFPKNLQIIGDYAFNRSGLRVVNIPKTVKEIGDHAFCNTPIDTIHVAEGNELYFSIDGVLFGINNKKDEKPTFQLIKYPPKKNLISYTVGAQVTSLDCCAFKGAANLQEIILHDNICDFGSQQTFAKCTNLKEICIPPKIKRLPSSCFNECEALENVYVCDREKLQIKMKSFEKCTSLKSIHFQMYNPENITVEIGAFDWDVFNKCVLYIPSGTRWAYRHHSVLGKFKNIEIEK